MIEKINIEVLGKKDTRSSSSKIQLSGRLMPQ